MALPIRYQRRVSPEGAAALSERSNTNIAEALNSFGRTVGRAVDPVIADQKSSQIQATLAAGGDVAPALGLTPIQRATNAVAARGYADRASIATENATTELHQTYNGMIPDGTDPAEYAGEFGKKLDEAVRPALDAIPAQWRGAAEQQYQANRTQAVTGLQEHAIGQQIKNHKAAMEAADKMDLDVLLLSARDGNAGELDKRAASMLSRRQEMVAAGLMPQAVADAEGIHVTGLALGEKLFGEVQRGGGPSLEDVQAGRGEAAALPLEARDKLAGQIRGYMAHVRSEQNHAMAVQDHNVNQQSSRLEAYATKQGHGIQLSDAETADQQALLNTPGAVKPDAYAKGFAARETFGIARQVATATPQQIEAVRAEWNANPPKTEAEYLIRKKGIETFDAREKALKDDPAAYAMEVMPDKYPPVILPADPADPAFAAGLAQLNQNAGLIESQFGTRANPMPKIQQEQLATMLRGLPAEQQAPVIAQIVSTFGERSDLVLDGIDKHGGAVMARAGSLTALGSAEVGSSILLGQEALNLKVVEKPKAADVHAQMVDSGVVGVFGRSSRAVAQIRKSAVARAAYLAGPSGDVNEHMAQAIRDVGGATGSFNGGAVAFPLGVSDNTTFAERVTSVTDSEIAAMGGDVGHLGFIGEAIRGGNARLLSNGDGLYSVMVGNTVAKNADGSDFVLDYSRIKGVPTTRLQLPSDPMAGGGDPGGR